MKKYLQDTYNGVYKVLLEPYMPSVKTLALLAAGVIIGLLWAYVIAPTTFYDADPSTLQQSWQDEWVKLIADRYAAANFDVSANVTDLLSRVDSPLVVVDRLLVTPGEEVNAPRLQAIRPFAEAAEPYSAAAPQPSAIANLAPFIIAPLVILILAIIVALLWGLILKGNLYDPAMRRVRGEKMSDEAKAMREQVQAAKQAEATQKSDFSSSSLGKPLMQRMSTFLLGHGQYDDSFSIEDDAQRFYGECGVSIAETVSSGGVDKPTALEVWLFDKEDFKRTNTIVIASPYAAADPAIRARLETRGEVVVAQPNVMTVLDTDGLKLQARVVDVQFGVDPALPANSFFQKVTTELAAWQKNGVPAVAPEIPTVSAAPVSIPAAAVAASPLAPPASTFAAYQPPTASPRPITAPPLSAPPASPLPASQPAPRAVPVTSPPPSSLPSYRPPSPAPPPGLDDDPFGGTGDFSPSGS